LAIGLMLVDDPLPVAAKVAAAIARSMLRLCFLLEYVTHDEDSD